MARITRPKPKAAPKPAGAVTMRDLARDLGVSVMTVSNALANRGHVSRETRERVLARGLALGFRPDTFASINGSRRGGRTAARLAVFVARRVLYEEGADWSLHRDLFFALARELSVHGIDLKAVDADAPECHGDLARSDAMVHLGSVAPELTEALSDHGRIHVSLFFQHPRCHGVLPDNDAAGRLAAEALWRAGHRTVAGWSAPTGEDRSARGASFLQHFKAMGRSAKAVNLFEIAGDDFERALAGVFGGDGKVPSALCLPNCAMALWAFKSLHKMAVAVPERVSLVGFDQMPVYRYMPKDITRFYFEPAAMARAAAVAIRTGMDDPGSRGLTTLVPIHHHPGETLRKI